MDEGLLLIAYDVTIALLFIALVIFGWLAVRSKSIRSFEFQISIFIVIWTLGEVVSVLLKSGLIRFSIMEDIGFEIHVTSMAFISVMLWLRLYYARLGGRKIVEDVSEYLR